MIESAFRGKSGGFKAAVAKMLDSVQQAASLTDGKWRKIDLKKIRFAESLRSHLTAFLQSFVERCVWQYATYLFSFDNLQLCCPNAPTGDLFGVLSQSDLIVPCEDLSLCGEVDLPSKVTCKSVSMTGETAFSDRSNKINFPFSFLIYGILCHSGKNG